MWKSSNPSAHPNPKTWHSPAQNLQVADTKPQRTLGVPWIRPQKRRCDSRGGVWNRSCIACHEAQSCHRQQNPATLLVSHDRHGSFPSSQSRPLWESGQQSTATAERLVTIFLSVTKSRPNSPNRKQIANNEGKCNARQAGAHTAQRIVRMNGLDGWPCDGLDGWLHHHFWMEIIFVPGFAAQWWLSRWQF